MLCSIDRRRGELAATVLTGKEEAVPLLAKALLETTDADRAWMIRKVLSHTVMIFIDVQKTNPALSFDRLRPAA